jgi:hypothetical protein
MVEECKTMKRKRNRLACLIKRGLENCVSFIKYDEYRCCIWLKIQSPNDLPIFGIGCYILHYDSKFCSHLDKDQPFSNLEKDISYFKTKGEIIVLRDMQIVRTICLQYDAQQSLMSHILRLEDDI